MEGILWDVSFFRGVGEGIKGKEELPVVGIVLERGTVSAGCE